MAQEKIYAGSGKTQSGQYGEFYKVSICLTDIPKEYVTTAKNGKEYVNLVVNKKKETDQYGKDLSVTVDTWKPDQSNTAKPAHTPKRQYITDDLEDNLPF